MADAPRTTARRQQRSDHMTTTNETGAPSPDAAASSTPDATPDATYVVSLLRNAGITEDVALIISTAFVVGALTGLPASDTARARIGVGIDLLIVNARHVSDGQRLLRAVHPVIEVLSTTMNDEETAEACVKRLISERDAERASRDATHNALRRVHEALLGYAPRQTIWFESLIDAAKGMVKEIDGLRALAEEHRNHAVHHAEHALADSAIDYFETTNHVDCFACGPVDGDHDDDCPVMAVVVARKAAH
jgi:hypothetical protein